MKAFLVGETIRNGVIVTKVELAQIWPPPEVSSRIRCDHAVNVAVKNIFLFKTAQMLVQPDDVDQSNRLRVLLCIDFEIGVNLELDLGYNTKQSKRGRSSKPFIVIRSLDDS